MRVVAGILLLALAGAVTTMSAQTAKKDVTITGEVVDIVNYVANGLKPDNADRKSVAEASARAGNPLGILERGTGKVYLVVMSQPNVSAVETLVPYFGLRVFVVGKVYKRGGLNLLMLSDIGKSVR